MQKKRLPSAAIGVELTCESLLNASVYHPPRLAGIDGEADVVAAASLGNECWIPSPHVPQVCPVKLVLSL